MRKKMKEEEKLFLSKYYEKARQKYLLEKQKNVTSILIGFLETKNNIRYNILNSASRKEDKISMGTITNLLKQGLIRRADKINNYVITAKGIWLMEKENDDINLEKLIDFLDKKYFNLFGGNKSLSDKEKIMLLFMIISRSFSEKTPIDLKKENRTKDTIETIIIQSHHLLKDNNILKSLAEKDLLNRKGNEHPVSDFIRHREALVRKTNSLYKTLRDQKYCLDLYIDGNFKVEELAYLLWLIFNTNMNIQIQEEFLKFSENIYQKSIFLYNTKEFTFFQPKYDDEIKKAFDEYFINMRVWNELK